MLCDKPRRSTATRHAECTGGCGKVLARCSRKEPICNECREKARRNPLAAPTDSEEVNLRFRQLQTYNHGVWYLVMAEVARFRRSHGRIPTRREYRHTERAVMHRLRDAGIPTTFEYLPKANTPAWDRMDRWLAAAVAAVAAEGLEIEIDPEKEFHGHDNRDDGTDDDCRPSDAGRTGERPATVAGGRHLALVGR